MESAVEVTPKMAIIISMMFSVRRYRLATVRKETDHSYAKAGTLRKRHICRERTLLWFHHTIHMISTSFNIYTDIDYKYIPRCQYKRHIVNSREKDSAPGYSNPKSQRNSDPNYQYQSQPQAENPQSQPHQHRQDDCREQFADSAHASGE